MKLQLFLLAGVLVAARSAQAQVSGNTAAAKTNPVCKLFSAAEASKYVGKKVGAGEGAAMGSGCQWATKDYDGDMMVQIVAASYYEQPSLAEGFERLPDVGPKAFVLPEMGGWKAATIHGNESLIVSVSGPAASRQTAVALLKDLISRRK
jgi:hypothetical protein